MLEVADREFQAIQDADKKIEDHAKTMVQRGDLGGIEITPNALKFFLDKRLGPDGRMSSWSYEWTARLLKRLGFRDLKQVELAIAPYDDHNLSMIAEGARQGQTSRFELMLLAALGERFNQMHPWSDPWFLARRKTILDRFENAGVQVATYNVDEQGVSDQPLLQEVKSNPAESD